MTMYFNKFEILTNKTRQQNLDKLKDIIFTDKLPLISFNYDYKNKPFFGKLDDLTFDILPVIEGRNSFVPVLKGQLTDETNSKIIVKMRLHLVVIAFIVFITTLILWTMKDNFNNGGLFVLPIIYSVTIFMYLKESKKTMVKFKSYFE